MNLEEIKRITGAATPGPWVVSELPGEPLTEDPLAWNCVAAISSHDDGDVIKASSMRRETLGGTNGDLRFIVMARNEIEKLIAIAEAALTAKRRCEEQMPNSGHMYLGVINRVHADLSEALAGLKS